MQVSNLYSLRPVHTGNIFLAPCCVANLYSKLKSVVCVLPLFSKLHQRIAASYDTVVIHARTLFKLPCSIFARQVVRKMLPLFSSWPLIRCFWKYICYVRDVGLIESALDSRSRNSGFKLDQSHCVVFLGVVLLGRPDRMMWGGMGETVLDLNSFWKVALRNSLKLSVHQSSCDFCFFFSFVTRPLFLLAQGVTSV